MRCHRATHLIHLDLDAGPGLSPRDLSLLQSHLRVCPRCRAYQRRARALIGALRADAQDIAAQPPPSAAYHDALHQRLAQAHETLTERPLASAERILLRALQATSFLPLRARQALAAAVLFVALTVALSTQVLEPGPPTPTDCRLGRMPSFRVQLAPNGRVYASLASQTALSHLPAQEAMP
jgi:predicted anti-sigma-YlaC factor YlaD